MKYLYPEYNKFSKFNNKTKNPILKVDKLFEQISHTGHKYRQ